MVHAFLSLLFYSFCFYCFLATCQHLVFWLNLNLITCNAPHTIHMHPHHLIHLIRSDDYNHLTVNFMMAIRSSIRPSRCDTRTSVFGHFQHFLVLFREPCSTDLCYSIRTLQTFFPYHLFISYF